MREQIIELPIQKEFIGREQIIQEFFETYNSIKQEEYQIINYYGMTGIGKTRLLSKLEKELEEKIENPYYIKIDMDFSLKKEIESDYITQNKEEILLKLRNKLIDKYKFKFDIFDQVLYEYYKKIGINKDKPEVQMLLSRNQNIEKVIGIIKDLAGPMGVLFNVITAVDMGVAFINKKRKKEIEIKDFTYEELYKILEYCFAIDLQENTSKLKSPLVILIDTYEILVKEVFGRGNQKINDKWLREENGIIPNVKNVLWVIAGREELKWSEIENNRIHVKKHKLEMLTQTESIELLQKSGIQDSKLCEQIYLKGDGVPMYLNLCIDQYLILEKNGINPQIEHFEQKLDVLANNIIKYMDISDQEILYYLSCMEKWDDEFIRKKGYKFITCFSYIRYNNLKNLSFVEKNENGYYTISKIAREILYSMCNEDIKIIVNENLGEYYTELLETKMPIEQEIDVLREFAKIKILNSEKEEIALENYKKIKEQLQMLEKQFRYKDEANIFKSIYQKINNNDEIAQNYIRALIKSGEYDLAEQVANTYMNKCENREEQIIAKAMLGEIYSYIGKYDESIELLEQAYSEKMEYIKQDDVNLLEKCANVYTRLGNYVKAMEIYTKIIEGGKSQNINLTKRNMANTYSYLGKYEESIKIYNELINELEPDDLEILSLKNNKAMTISRMGDNEQAYKILQEVYEKRKEILGDEHPETLRTEHNIATLLSHLNKFDESIKLFDAVYEKRVNKLGKEHPDTLATLNGKAMTYLYKGEKDEAVKLIEEVYKQRCNHLGEYNPATISTLNNMAIIYQEKGNYELAKQKAKEVYDKRCKILGKSHPDTLATKKLLEEMM